MDPVYSDTNHKLNTNSHSEDTAREMGPTDCIPSGVTPPNSVTTDTGKLEEMNYPDQDQSQRECN